MKKHISINWLPWIILLLVGIVSCIKEIREPDVWWQVRTGEWILENNEVPTSDMLSFTYNEEPWVNVKWGSEVLMATVADMGGVELLPLLQIFCVIGILIYLLKINLIFRQRLFKDENRIPGYGIILGGLLLLFIVNYRLNSRPEMFTHLLSCMMVYYLLRYKDRQSNWIFIIIPLQIIWTNLHEAYGMGIVLILIFTLSYWFEFLFLKKKTDNTLQEKPIKLSIAAVVSFFAVAINPYGAKMIAHPFNIFGQLHENKFTTELLSYSNKEYWHIQSFLMLILVFIVIYAFTKVLSSEKKKVSFIFRATHNFSLGYALTTLAFLYLALSAFRNIPFFIFLAIPVFAVIIESKVNSAQKKWIPYGLTIVGLIFYVSITTNGYYTKVLKRDQYGMQVNTEKNPIGAADFLRDNNISGKGFVDYFSSSYFLYELQPHYKSYIDLRDLDVFPKTFFENVFTVYQNPGATLAGGQILWNYLYELDQFDYVVLLNSPEMQNLNRHLLFNDQRFELVYADPLNSVYLRRTDGNQELINKIGFNQGQNDVYHWYTTKEPSGLASGLTKLFWPFYKQNNTIDQRKSNSLRMGYYQYLGIPNYVSN